MEKRGRDIEKVEKERRERNSERDRDTRERETKGQWRER